MTMAHDLIDQFSPMDDGDKPLATWYAQGHSDGLGDRLLMFDNTSAPSWEILRFRPWIGCDKRFEAALRAQIERLISFHHPAFPLVRPIKELGREDGLAVVSTFAPGPRLSDALKKPRSAAFAVRLIRQLVPALAALQQHSPGLAHGVLNAERIIVTAEGGLMIREHMVGAAVGSLELTGARLWSELGVVASPRRTDVPTLDCRSDIIQLGLVALSLLVGHRVGPDEYPDKVDDLLDEVADRCDRHARVIFQPLRYWLERALQLDDFMFESASDANDALSELRDEPERTDDYPAATNALPPAADALHPSPLHDGNTPPPRLGPRLIAPRRDVDEQPVAPPSALIAPAPLESVEPEIDAAPSELVPFYHRIGTVGWVAAAVAVLAIGQTLYIARLLRARAATPPPVTGAVLIESPQPGANVLVDNQPVGVTPLRLDVGSATKSIRVMPPAPPPDAQTLDPSISADQKELTAKTVGKPPLAAPPIASARTGAFRLSAPVVVNVFDGERVLGSSADGPIVAPAGRRELEFVNSAIGYRERRVVDVKAGQITTLSLKLPNGTMNINAVPWAFVWIDGNAIGETPLGNVSIAIGEHEIVFRHPGFGERRQKTLVRADTPARVSVNMQKPAEPAKR